MKIYYCLIQNNPLVNGVPCYHILQCEEIDTDDRERFEALRQEFEKLYYTRPGVSTILLHLPTTDVKSLMRHAEGSSSPDPNTLYPDVLTVDPNPKRPQKPRLNFNNQ